MPPSYPYPSPPPLRAIARRLSAPVPVIRDETRRRPLPSSLVAACGALVGASLVTSVAMHGELLPALGSVVIGVGSAALLVANERRRREAADRGRREAERTHAHAHRVAGLLESARGLTEQGSEAGVYEQLARHARALVPHDDFSLAIFDDRGALAGRYSAAGIIDGLNAEPASEELAVVRSGKALLDDGASRAPLDIATGKAGIPLERVRDACVPVFAGRALVGVVTVRRGQPGYIAEELDALAALCQQAGIAIGRARLFMQVLSVTREWERVFDATAEGLALIDGAGRIRRCNSAFAGFLGISTGSTAGQDHHQLRSLDFARSGECAICRTIREGRRAEHVIEDADGRVLRLTLSPYPTGGVVVVAQDVTAETQMRAAQQQLFESDKFASIGRLAAGVAHEVNNPLMGINSLATVLLEDASLAGESRDIIALIQRESRRAAKVTRDLLSFVRTDDDRRSEVNLDDVAREVAELRALQQRAAGVTMVLELAGDLPPTRASRAQLVQVLINLVTNAEDAVEGRATREIRVGTWRTKHGVALRVDDSGTGIPDEVRPRLFEPFFTTKAPGRGTGLGLSLSFAIVERHGGSLRASDAPGGGARFVIELPAVVAAKIAAA